VLHYLEEMTLHEVAAVLEILPGTVKSRLAYGLARLRRHTAGAQMNAGGGTHT
jgi:DNA-directed RNA polymerase specialized sigma24 family protein